MTRPYDFIFVGGTGRCGTGIMKVALGKHPKVYGPRGDEPKFLVQPGGFLDLAGIMAHEWDPWRGDEAVASFFELCTRIRTEESKRAKEWVREHLVVDVTDAARSDSPRPQMYETEPHFIGRAEMMDFVQHVFQCGDRIVVDDTPFSVLSLAPTNLLVKKIHMLRHPRDVLSSQQSKRWAPSDWRLCARRIANTLQEILGFTAYAVKLEDLVARPKPTMSGVLRYLDLEWHEDCARVFSKDKAHIGRGKNLPPEGEVAYMEFLAPLAKDFEYD